MALNTSNKHSAMLVDVLLRVGRVPPNGQHDLLRYAIEHVKGPVLPQCVDVLLRNGADPRGSVEHECSLLELVVRRIRGSPTADPSLQRCSKAHEDFIKDMTAGTEHKANSSTQTKADLKVVASLVQALTKRKWSLDSVDPLGWTPLFYAVASGNTDSTHILLTKGARIDLVDNRGLSVWDVCTTAAMRAKLVQHTEREFGVLLGLLSEAEKGDRKQQAKLQELIDNGVDRIARDPKDALYGGIMHRVLGDLTTAVRLLPILVDCGAYCNMKNIDGVTPLGLLCSKVTKENSDLVGRCMRFLLERNSANTDMFTDADMDKFDKAGLSRASSKLLRSERARMRDSIPSLFVKRDVAGLQRVVHSGSFTPQRLLFMATDSQRTNDECMQLLLEAKANPYVEDEQGFDTFYHAQKNGSATVRMLQERFAPWDQLRYLLHQHRDRACKARVERFLLTEGLHMFDWHTDSRKQYQATLVPTTGNERTQEMLKLLKNAGFHHCAAADSRRRMPVLLQWVALQLQHSRMDDEGKLKVPDSKVEDHVRLFKEAIDRGEDFLLTAPDGGRIQQWLQNAGSADKTNASFYERCRHLLQRQIHKDHEVFTALSGKPSALKQLLDKNAVDQKKEIPAEKKTERKSRLGIGSGKTPREKSVGKDNAPSAARKTTAGRKKGKAGPNVTRPGAKTTDTLPRSKRPVQAKKKGKTTQAKTETADASKENDVVEKKQPSWETVEHRASAHRHGMSALIAAVQTGSLSHVQILLEHKANVAYADPDGATALEHAVQSHKPESSEIVAALLQAGAPVGARVREACTSKNKAVVEQWREASVHVKQQLQRKYAVIRDPSLRQVEEVEDDEDDDEEDEEKEEKKEKEEKGKEEKKEDLKEKAKRDTERAARDAEKLARETKKAADRQQKRNAEMKQRQKAENERREAARALARKIDSQLDEVNKMINGLVEELDSTKDEVTLFDSAMGTNAAPNAPAAVLVVPAVGVVASPMQGAAASPAAVPSSVEASGDTLSLPAVASAAAPVPADTGVVAATASSDDMIGSVEASASPGLNTSVSLAGVDTASPSELPTDSPVRSRTALHAVSPNAHDAGGAAESLSIGPVVSEDRSAAAAATAATATATDTAAAAALIAGKKGISPAGSPVAQKPQKKKNALVRMFSNLLGTAANDKAQDVGNASVNLPMATTTSTQERKANINVPLDIPEDEEVTVEVGDVPLPDVKEAEVSRVGARSRGWTAVMNKVMVARQANIRARLETAGSEDTEQRGAEKLQSSLQYLMVARNNRMENLSRQRIKFMEAVEKVQVKRAAIINLQAEEQVNMDEEEKARIAEQQQQAQEELAQALAELQVMKKQEDIRVKTLEVQQKRKVMHKAQAEERINTDPEQKERLAKHVQQAQDDLAKSEKELEDLAGKHKLEKRELKMREIEQKRKAIQQAEQENTKQEEKERVAKQEQQAQEELARAEKELKELQEQEKKEMQQVAMNEELVAKEQKLREMLEKRQADQQLMDEKAQELRDLIEQRKREAEESVQLEQQQEDEQRIAELGKKIEELQEDMALKGQEVQKLAFNVQETAQQAEEERLRQQEKLQKLDEHTDDQFQEFEKRMNAIANKFDNTISAQITKRVEKGGFATLREMDEMKATLLTEMANNKQLVQAAMPTSADVSRELKQIREQVELFNKQVWQRRMEQEEDETQLDALEEEQEKLMSVYHEKQDLLMEQQRIMQQPSLCAFYNRAQSKLTEFLLAYKVRASGMLAADNSNATTNRIDLAGEWIPIPGIQIVTDFLSGLASVVQAGKHKAAQSNVSKMMTSIGAMEKGAEEFARLLTQRYEQQVLQIDPREGCPLLAELAVARVVAFLQGGSIESSGKKAKKAAKSAENESETTEEKVQKGMWLNKLRNRSKGKGADKQQEQQKGDTNTEQKPAGDTGVSGSAVGAISSGTKLLIQAVFVQHISTGRLMANTKIPTIAGGTWTDRGALQGPGIRTADGEFFVKVSSRMRKDGSDEKKYGWIIGSAAEARGLGMKKLEPEGPPPAISDAERRRKVAAAKRKQEEKEREQKARRRQKKVFVPSVALASRATASTRAKDNRGEEARTTSIEMENAEQNLAKIHSKALKHKRGVDQQEKLVAKAEREFETRRTRVHELLEKEEKKTETTLARMEEELKKLQAELGLSEDELGQHESVAPKKAWGTVKQSVRTLTAFKLASASNKFKEIRDKQEAAKRNKSVE